MPVPLSGLCKFRYGPVNCHWRFANTVHGFWKKLVRWDIYLVRSKEFYITVWKFEKPEIFREFISVLFLVTFLMWLSRNCSHCTESGKTWSLFFRKNQHFSVKSTFILKKLTKELISRKFLRVIAFHSNFTHCALPFYCHVIYALHWKLFSRKCTSKKFK